MPACHAAGPHKVSANSLSLVSDRQGHLLYIWSVFNAPQVLPTLAQFSFKEKKKKRQPYLSSCQNVKNIELIIFFKQCSGSPQAAGTASSADPCAVCARCCNFWRLSGWCHQWFRSLHQANLDLCSSSLARRKDRKGRAGALGAPTERNKLCGHHRDSQLVST